LKFCKSIVFLCDGVYARYFVGNVGMLNLSLSLSRMFRFLF